MLQYIGINCLIAGLMMAIIGAALIHKVKLNIAEVLIGIGISLIMAGGLTLTILGD